MQYTSFRRHHHHPCIKWNNAISFWYNSSMMMIIQLWGIITHKRCCCYQVTYRIRCPPRPYHGLQQQQRQRQFTSLLSSLNDVHNLDDLFKEILNAGKANSTMTTTATTTTTATPPTKHNNFFKTTEPPSIKDDAMNNSNDGWRRIDWDNHIGMDSNNNNVQSEHPVPPSPVDILMIRDRLVYVKRDDQARLMGSQINGNKARKMLSLQCMDSETFPSCVVSYGGPQSNSMLAIAAVVQYHNTQLEQLYSPNTSAFHPDCDSNNCDNNMDENGHDDESDDGVLPTSSSSTSFVRRKFVYYTKKLPSFLQKQPSGNLFRALSLGMELREVSHEEYNRLFASNDSSNYISDNNVAPIQLPPPIYGDSVWIPQGGACAMAVRGTGRLAQEIYEYWKWNGNNQPLSVCIPGGTCSTALLVHRALQSIQATNVRKGETKLDIEVVVIPCVGGEYYAQRQMMYLNTHLSNSGTSTTNVEINDQKNIPSILRPTIPISEWNNSINSDSNKNDNNTNDYFRFGQPHPMILQTFRELRDEYDLVVDLLYGAPSWTILFRHWTSATTTTTGSTTSSSTATNPTTFNPNAPLDGRRIMYVHSGGVEGISSQLLRYKHMNLIDMDEIQLPGRNNNS